VLYLVVGYLYFLPLIGKEPIKWKVSYPLRMFLLFIAMPVDAFTGVVLGSYQTDPFVPLEPRTWGPSAVNDLHDGGAVMWIGGAAIMFVLILVTFFQWTRETRSSASMGWLESARQSNLAERIAEANPADATSEPARNRVAGGAVRTASVDDDEDQLAAYNEYLARINGSESGRAAD
jgi:putative copper resistance protein D